MDNSQWKQRSELNELLNWRLLWDDTLRWASVYTESISSEACRRGHHITAEHLRIKAFFTLQQRGSRPIPMLTQRLRPAIVFKSQPYNRQTEPGAVTQ